MTFLSAKKENKAIIVMVILGVLKYYSTYYFISSLELHEFLD